MSTLGTGRARVPSRVSAGVPTGGQFAASARAETDVSLSEPDQQDETLPSREELLAAPELVGLPPEWLAPKTDREIADWLVYAREKKATHLAEQAAAQDARAAETARRRAYRRPSWLVKDGDVYSTDDGYRATTITDIGDGRARTSYVVRAPDGAEAEVERVEEIADWITQQRNGATQEATR